MGEGVPVHNVASHCVRTPKIRHPLREREKPSEKAFYFGVFVVSTKSDNIKGKLL